MKKIVPALIAGLCLASAATAAPLSTIPVKDSATAESLSRDGALPYTYAEFGYLSTTYDDFDADGTSFSLGGSYLFMPNIFAMGSYSNGDVNNEDLSSLQLGAGYRYPLSMTVDLAGGLEVVQISSDTEDETGYQLTLGARGQVMNKIEGFGNLLYTDVLEDAATTLNFGALYDLSQFVPKLQAGLDLYFGDDALLAESAKSYGLKVRYSF